MPNLGVLEVVIVVVLLLLLPLAQVKCLKFKVPKVPKVKGTKMTITCFGPVFIGLKWDFLLCRMSSHFFTFSGKSLKFFNQI